MSKTYPRNADIIAATYEDKFGRLVVLAHTDRKGIPHLAWFSLTTTEKLAGRRPAWVCNTAFRGEIILGYQGETPAYINAKVKISVSGLSLTVTPSHLYPIKERAKFTHISRVTWDEATPDFLENSDSLKTPSCSHNMPAGGSKKMKDAGKCPRPLPSHSEVAS